jgi:hypothetical protein
MGDKLLPGNDENPKGYFEDETVNSINEELLMPVVPAGPKGFIGKYILRSRLPYGMRWLARVPLGTNLTCSPTVRDQMIRVTCHEPFCLKDPRFSYTLGLWRPVLCNPVFACIFRDPGITVRSMLTHCSKGSYPSSVVINAKIAFEIWVLMYRHILETHHPSGGDWIFLHYNQLLDGSAYKILTESLEAVPNRQFADVALSRSRANLNVPRHVASIYEELCGLARYCDNT